MKTLKTLQILVCHCNIQLDDTKLINTINKLITSQQQ